MNRFHLISLIFGALFLIAMSAPVLGEDNPARFAAVPSSGPAPLHVTFIGIPDPSQYTYVWNFGDGSEILHDRPQTEYTYDVAGNYTVELQVLFEGDIKGQYRLPIVVHPIVKFTANLRTGTAPFIVEFKDESTGKPIEWEWTFTNSATGIPLTSTEKDPIMTFTELGFYTVELKVTYENLLEPVTHSAPNYITVLEPGSPIAHFEGFPREGNVPLTVRFFDRSEGDIDKWLWDFDTDKISSELLMSEERDPVIQYKEPGVYNVTLQVWDENGKRAMYSEPDFITVRSLVVDFVGTPSSGPVPLTVQFFDRSTEGAFDRLEWDFGGGRCALENPVCTGLKDPVVVYDDAGRHTVTLTAWTIDDIYSDFETKLDYIEVTNVTAAFLILDPVVYPGADVRFQDVSSGNPTEWEWRFAFDPRRPNEPADLAGSRTIVFNDPESKELIYGQNRPVPPVYKYNKPGRYNVQMTVYDGAGNVHTAPLQEVHVVNPELEARFDTMPCTPAVARELQCSLERCVQFNSDRTIADGNSITSWEWDFSDGSVRFVPNPARCFPGHGDYVVILRVSNEFPKTNTDYQIVTVPLIPPVPTVINSWPASGNGWFWPSETQLHITSAGNYRFANSGIPNGITVDVDAEGVTLNGEGVIIRSINGQPDLNLQSITLYNDRLAFSGSAITECYNIVDSSIFVKSANSVNGIGELYGKMDATTSIIVESIGSSANGIDSLYGTISGGVFAVTGTGHTHGVRDVTGTISGGEFAVIGKDGAANTAGIGSLSGTISGGEFTVIGSGYWTQGVRSLNGGTVSGGTFLVSGQQGAYGVYSVSDTSTLSGGEFWARGKEFAYGIGWIYSSVESTVIGGTINAWGPNWWATSVIGYNPLTGEYVPNYEFWSPIDGQHYTKDTTVYHVNAATLREIYDNGNYNYDTNSNAAVAMMQVQDKKQPDKQEDMSA